MAEKMVFFVLFFVFYVSKEKLSIAIEALNHDGITRSLARVSQCKADRVPCMHCDNSIQYLSSAITIFF